MGLLVHFVDPAASVAVTLTVLLSDVVTRLVVLALLDNLTGLSVRLLKVRRTNLEESKGRNICHQNQHEGGNRHALTLTGAILDHDQSDYSENDGRDGQERTNHKNTGQGRDNAQD